MVHRPPECFIVERNSRPARGTVREVLLKEVWEPHQSGTKFYLLPPYAVALIIHERCYITPHPDPRRAEDAREFMPGTYKLEDDGDF
jgi:hypothetical protein